MSDDTGYDLDDPKHPTFHERYAEQADLERKREKEGGRSLAELVDPRIAEAADAFRATAGTLSETDPHTANEWRGSDPKPKPAIRDADVYKQFHRMYDSCIACGNRNITAAHLLRGKYREDVLAALVPLCGGGSGPGCHAAFDSRQAYNGDFGHRVTPKWVDRQVAAFLRSEAGDDQRAYLEKKLGPFGPEWYCLKLEEAK